MQDLSFTLSNDRAKVLAAVRVRPKREDTYERYENVCVYVSDDANTPSHGNRQQQQHGQWQQQPANFITAVNPENKDQLGFSFDTVLDDRDGQQTLFEEVVAEPLDVSLQTSSDLAIIAYGATASGKTYTTLGERCQVGLLGDLVVDEHAGLFVRIIDCVMRAARRFEPRSSIDAAASTSASLLLPQQQTLVTLSAVELYNESLQDLLAPSRSSHNNLGGMARIGVEMREVGEDLVLVNQHRVIVDSAATVKKCFDAIYRNRAVASTALNDTSSRSHALIFIDVYEQDVSPLHDSCAATDPAPPLDLATATAFDLQQLMNGSGNNTTGALGSSGGVPSVVERLGVASPLQRSLSAKSVTSFASPNATVTVTASTPPVKNIRRSRISLIDLAGNERIKKSGATGKELTEALYVNKSLSALGLVVISICQGAKHIPFRDSRITRLLRPSFMKATSRIVFVTTVSPTSSSFHETVSSLRFTNRLKDLKCLSLSTSQQVGACSSSEAMLLRLQRVVDELTSDLRIANASCGYSLQLRSTHFQQDMPAALLSRALNGREVLAAYRSQQFEIRQQEAVQQEATLKTAVASALEELTTNADELRRSESIESHQQHQQLSASALIAKNSELEAEVRKQLAKLEESSVVRMEQLNSGLRQMQQQVRSEEDEGKTVSDAVRALLDRRSDLKMQTTAVSREEQLSDEEWASGVAALYALQRHVDNEQEKVVVLAEHMDDADACADNILQAQKLRLALLETKSATRRAQQTLLVWQRVSRDHHEGAVSRRGIARTPPTLSPVGDLRSFFLDVDEYSAAAGARDAAACRWNAMDERRKYVTEHFLQLEVSPLTLYFSPRSVTFAEFRSPRKAEPDALASKMDSSVVHESEGTAAAAAWSAILSSSSCSDDDEEEEDDQDKDGSRSKAAPSFFTASSVSTFASRQKSKGRTRRELGSSSVDEEEDCENVQFAVSMLERYGRIWKLVSALLGEADKHKSQRLRNRDVEALFDVLDSVPMDPLLVDKIRSAATSSPNNSTSCVVDSSSNLDAAIDAISAAVLAGRDPAPDASANQEWIVGWFQKASVLQSQRAPLNESEYAAAANLILFVRLVQALTVLSYTVHYSSNEGERFQHLLASAKRTFASSTPARSEGQSREVSAARRSQQEHLAIGMQRLLQVQEPLSALRELTRMCVEHAAKCRIFHDDKDGSVAATAAAGIEPAVVPAKNVPSVLVVFEALVKYF